MRGLLLFAAGVIAGVLIMQPGQAQPDRMPGLRLNHVGVFAKNFDESYNFYTKTLGFREAFSLKDKDGKPTVTYIQINRDTFLELAAATGDRTPGVSHVGILADDLNGTVAALRLRGVKVDDPRTGATKAPLTSVMDPNGIRLELLDFTPESMQRKAIEAWK
jgi:catechol 2,3-dioxygenase-like lactoylglutathione lyase family enzyme